MPAAKTLTIAATVVALTEMLVDKIIIERHPSKIYDVKKRWFPSEYLSLGNLK